MKHARSDYDRIQDPENKIPDDEPVFLLRAQDDCAAEAVRYWAWLVERRHGESEITKAARKQSDKMWLWPNRKAPDMPE